MSRGRRNANGCGCGPLVTLVVVGLCSLFVLVLLSSVRGAFTSDPPNAATALIILIASLFGGVLLNRSPQLVHLVLERRARQPSPIPTPTPAPSPTGAIQGSVYLLQSGPYYKVGRASDYQKRVRRIKLQLPFRVVEVHRILTADEVALEAYWHKKFADVRQNGEWFLLSKADVAEFCRHNTM
jgi:hypothetical protein